MDFGSRSARFLAMLGCLVALLQCRKVPLSQDYGYLEIAAAHWFENEKVTYVFFSMRERPDLKARGTWQLAYTKESAAGGTERVDFQDIDFSSGVHGHRLVDCARNRICGSFSFRSDEPLLEADIRYYYDSGSALGLEATAAVQNHLATDFASSYSALPYGVFDKKNEHLQVRIHNNFGSPSDDEVSLFGLERSFIISDPRLATITMEDYMAARETTGGAFVFPSGFCTPTNAGTLEKRFAGSRAWFDTSFNTETADEGACFHVKFLDKAGKMLLEEEAFGLKNPIQDISNYTFQTPLRKAKQIYTLVAYCGDEGSVKDDDFLDYQRFILGMKNRAPDVCLDFNDLEGFEQDLDTYFTNALNYALANNEQAQDVIFVIAYHQILSSEFFNFHQKLAARLTTLIASHAERVSPRLVGAIVYDTGVKFRPTAAQRQNMIWCPQELDPVLVAAGMADVGSENCISTPAAELDLEVINFVAPLGPFPSLDNYLNYIEDFGDRGLAGNPRLEFYSVPTSASTRHEKNQTVTFFDNERIALGAGEAMRMCPGINSAEFYSLFEPLRFRTTGMADSTKSMTADEIAPLWLENEDGGEFEIGIAWDLSFWGTVRYTSVLTGNVMSAIPFQQSSRAREQVGDPIWSRTTWNVGAYIQHCRKYCDHPVFDAQGVYQPYQSWRRSADTQCTPPRYPVYEEGA